MTTSMNRVTKIELALLLLASKTGTVFSRSKKRPSGLAAMSSRNGKRHHGKKAKQDNAAA